MSLIKSFNEIEKEYFNKKINGIFIWPLLREKVYADLNSISNNTKKSGQSDKEQSLSKKIRSFLAIVSNTFNFFLKHKNKVGYLFINHPRKKLVNGFYYDLYTDPIINDLKEDYFVLEGLFQLNHLKPSFQKNILYADIFDFWPRLISLLWTPKFTVDEVNLWKSLEEKFENEFGLDVSILEPAKKEYVRARISIWGIKKLLKKLQPKLIIEVVGYNRLCKHVNIAAKELGIKTIELQHGYLSDKHVAYNFPKGIETVNSFPDYFGAWSSFFDKGRVRFPISSDKIIDVGFKYFHEHFDKVKNKAVYEGSILFISQGTIGDKLSKVALELSQLSDEKIIFKLHPSEIQDAHVRYPELYSLKSEHFIIDDSIDSDLYKRIIEAKIVVGVYSTALLEAASVGKKTVVLKLPGWKEFEYLFSSKKNQIIVCEAKAVDFNKIIMNYKIEPENVASLSIIGKYNKDFMNDVLVGN